MATVSLVRSLFTSFIRKSGSKHKINKRKNGACANYNRSAVFQKTMYRVCVYNF